MVCHMSTSGSREALAGEARAALGRASISVRQLALATGHSHAFWSTRLSGAKAMTLDELNVIAEQTGVPFADLLDAARQRAS